MSKYAVYCIEYETDKKERCGVYDSYEEAHRYRTWFWHEQDMYDRMRWGYFIEEVK